MVNTWKYSLTEFNSLTKKHGSWSSWAIWEFEKSREKEKNTEIISQNIASLNVRNIIIGLNISNKVTTWGNFRGGKHDRKLKYAFNDSVIRGAYMTDLFRINEKSSSVLKIYLSNNPKCVEENVFRFVSEMRDLNINSDTRFILLGTEDSVLGKYFKSEFQKYFNDNPLVFHRHYSSRGTDKAWVESIWSALEINANYEFMLEKYILNI